MKLTIKRTALHAALSRLKPAVSARMALPVLSGFLLTAEAQSANLRATNLDLTVETRAEAVVSRGGAVVIPLDGMLTAVAQMTAEDVTIAVEGNRVLIACGNSKLALCFMSPDEFPALYNREWGQPALIDGLQAALAAAVPFCSQDKTRYALQGVHLLDGQVAACDGSMAFFATLPSQAVGIIPTEAAKLISEQEGDCLIRSCEGMISAICGETTITSKLIEGNSPNLKAVIPEGHVDWPTVTVNRAELLAAIAYCSALGDEALYSRIRLDIDKGAMRVWMRNDKADDEISRELACKAGAGVKIAFSQKRLATCLKAFVGETVALRIQSDMDPIVIEQDGRIAVVMPHRIK